jgi:ureidoacrylate peracid hydrolase
MLQLQIGKTALNFGLIIVDMQNGFVSRNGSYDKLVMNTLNYRKVVPTIRNLI